MNGDHHDMDRHDMHGDRHDMGMHGDRHDWRGHRGWRGHHYGSGHRHCRWTFHHHHRVRVCW
jgi:hypothetical protein